MTERRQAHAVTLEAITSGPYVQWGHIDGPLMSWAGELHWLTWRERLAVFLRRKTVRDVAAARWPWLAAAQEMAYLAATLPSQEAAD